MFPSNGFLATKFPEDGQMTSGTLTKSKLNKSPRANEISKAELTIEQLAQSSRSSVDDVITNLLSKSVPQLQTYVIYCGETPLPSLTDLAYQVALLRMQDIAQVAGILDANDYEAQCQIENAEDDIIQSGSPQAKYVLPSDVQACINIIMEHICEMQHSAGGSGTCNEMLQQLNGFSGNYFNYLDTLQDAVVSDIGYTDPYSDLANNTDYTDINYDIPGEGPAPDSGGTGILSPAATLGSNPILPPSAPQIVSAPGTSPATSGSSTGNGILAGIGTALGGILGSTINSVAQSAQGAASNLASTAIKDAITKNLPLIIGSVILIVVIILIIVYAAKRGQGK